MNQNLTVLLVLRRTETIMRKAMRWEVGSATENARARRQAHLVEKSRGDGEDVDIGALGSRSERGSLGLGSKEGEAAELQRQEAFAIEKGETHIDLRRSTTPTGFSPFVTAPSVSSSSVVSCPLCLLNLG